MESRWVVVTEALLESRWGLHEAFWLDLQQAKPSGIRSGHPMECLLEVRSEVPLGSQTGSQLGYLEANPWDCCSAPEWVVVTGCQSVVHSESLSEHHSVADSGFQLEALLGSQPAPQ